jgi:ADP-ribose pyrophosphatase
MTITGERILYNERWLVLKQKSYLALDGHAGTWTYVERTGGQKAVVIVPITRESGSLVFIEQYRVPLETTVVEFPAGLVDPGEDLEVAAHRELKEETGFEGEILEVGPPVSTTAGLSTEAVHMVFMRVGERPAAESTPESSERITVRVVAPADLGRLLEEYRRREFVLDAKLYMYLKERSRAPARQPRPGA